MTAPRIYPHRCPADHPCPAVRACPAGAMFQEGFSAPEIKADACTGCGLCERICPYGAISAAQPAGEDHLYS